MACYTRFKKAFFILESHLYHGAHVNWIWFLTYKEFSRNWRISQRSYVRIAYVEYHRDGTVIVGSLDRKLFTPLYANFFKTREHWLSIWSLLCTELHSKKVKSVENIGKVSFTPCSKIWLSLLIFQGDSHFVSGTVRRSDAANFIYLFERVWKLGQISFRLRRFRKVRLSLCRFSRKLVPTLTNFSK